MGAAWGRLTSVKEIKRKLHMVEKIMYESCFEQYDVEKVKPTGQLNVGDIMSYDFGFLAGIVRVSTEQSHSEFHILQQDGSANLVT